LAHAKSSRQRKHGGAPPGKARRTFFDQLRDHAAHVSACGLERHASFHARDRCQIAAGRWRRRIDRQRCVDFHRACCREREAGWHHPDDLVRKSLEHEHLSDDVASATVVPLPESIAEDDGRRRIGGIRGASQKRSNAEGIEE
jgi:hypothetical protein